MNLEEFATQWINDIDALSNDSELPRTESFLTDLWLKGNHEQLWEFICHTAERDLSERVASYLAAGPLEDLLASAGPEFIDRVEALASKSSKFKYLLQGVWRNEIEESVWQRIQSILGKG